MKKLFLGLCITVGLYASDYYGFVSKPIIVNNNFVQNINDIHFKKIKVSECIIQNQLMLCNTKDKKNLYIKFPKYIKQSNKIILSVPFLKAIEIQYKNILKKYK